VPSNVSRRGLWTAGIILLLGFGLPQLPAIFTMNSLGADLLTFEFVCTERRAQQILAGWGDAGRDAARTQLVWDFGFIVGYGLLLWLGAKAAGTGRLIVSLGPAAAVADLCENLTLIRLLNGDLIQPWPALATLFASLKFIGILVCILAFASRRWIWRS
jgi:hypothetical protein